MIDSNEFLDELKRYIDDNYKTLTAAARHWGVSHQFVSKVLYGVTPPTQVMLDDIGYKRHKSVSVEYEKVGG